MELFHDILFYTLSAILTLAEIALFLRAILSWFDPMGEGHLSSFLYMITEPLIYPIRRLFEKKGWFEGSLFDVPFFAVVFIIAILRASLAIF